MMLTGTAICWNTVGGAHARVKDIVAEIAAGIAGGTCLMVM